MSTAEIINKISLLPESLKAEILQVIEKWLNEKSGIKKRQPGLASGKIKLKPNFDEPIDDFKDYQ